MAEIYSGYSAPARIFWTDASTGASSMSLTTYTVAKVRPGGRAVRICWTSPYYTFQVQWRTRLRRAPGNASASSEGQSSSAPVESWTGWGPWQGNALSADVKTDTERLPWGDLSVTTAVFALAYDFSQYDRIEHQVRVRVFDEPSLTCSEWAYAELPVVYEPVFESATATRRPGGAVDLSVATNWGRGGNRLRVNGLRRDSAEASPTGWTAVVQGAEPEASVAVPASAAGNASTLYVDMAFTTSDGASAIASRMAVEVSDDEPAPGAEPPSVAVSDVGFRAKVAVSPPSGASYDAVHVSATWPDALGGTTSEEAEAVCGPDGTWEAWVEAPPYDVGGVYRVWAVYGDGFAYAEAAHVTPSKGRVTWSDGAEGVSLFFDLALSSAFTLPVETVQTAGGATAARLGLGGSRKLSVEGKLLSPSVADGAWRPALDALRRPRVWLLRKPGGERYRVAVTAVGESEERGAVDLVVSASVSMQEVG